MQFEVVRFVSASATDFVDFWSQQYQYDFQELYDNNVGRALTEERIWQMYRWKNGTAISAKKKKSIRSAYLSQLKTLPNLVTLEEGKAYIASLKGGAIWGVFWLHCIKPKLFPIFDQHTYRSMAKINGLEPPEIPTAKTKKLDAYFEQYIPFTKRFSGISSRDLDKALFAYGRFLKRGLSGK